MRKYAALIACALVALTGCSVSVGTDSDEPEPTAEPTVESMAVADLEDLVAGSVTPDDEGAEVSAECAGEIDVEVDAAQTCHLTVGEQIADVHVVVTEVDDGEIVDADITPYLPADRVAETIQASLEEQGSTVDSVDCEGELAGEKGATMGCTATAGTDAGEITVEVTKVDGLFINFHFVVK